MTCISVFLNEWSLDSIWEQYIMVCMCPSPKIILNLDFFFCLFYCNLKAITSHVEN